MPPSSVSQLITTTHPTSSPHQRSSVTHPLDKLAAEEPTLPYPHSSAMHGAPCRSSRQAARRRTQRLEGAIAAIEPEARAACPRLCSRPGIAQALPKHYLLPDR